MTMTRNHPADRVILNPHAIATMTTDDLFAADIELAGRAAMLGKRGKVSKPHAAVRRELVAR
jgi:hypothetical protein